MWTAISLIHVSLLYYLPKSILPSSLCALPDQEDAAITIGLINVSWTDHTS